MIEVLRRLVSLRHRPEGHTYQLVKESQPSCVDELLSSTALFLISPGRSGTKSLVDFCSRYTSMLCMHAPTPWLASIGYLYHLNKISSDGAKYAFYAAREPYLIRAFQQQRVFFDGDCKNLPLSLEIADLMPASRFIHLVRKPENFIRSGLARGYFKSTPHELWGHLTESEYKNDASISLQEQIEKIAYFWNEANRIAIDAQRQLGPHRVTTLVAETMFQRPLEIVGTLRQLGLAEVVQDHRAYAIRNLNKQKHKRDHSPETNRLIDQTVRRVCTTRSMYYD